MWKDNDDKIMDILENIETLNRQDFPVVCPICGGKEGHLYFHMHPQVDAYLSAKRRYVGVVQLMPPFCAYFVSITQMVEKFR